MGLRPRQFSRDFRVQVLRGVHPRAPIRALSERLQPAMTTALSIMTEHQPQCLSPGPRRAAYVHSMNRLRALWAAYTRRNRDIPG
jgi:hypothetical protein